MWIKVSDIFTEAFFHNAPTNLGSSSIQYSDNEQENQEVRVSSESDQDYWQGLCDVDQSV